MPFSASALNMLRGDAGMAAHADADDRNLGDVGRALLTSKPTDVPLAASRTSSARAQSAAGTVKVMSVCLPSSRDVLDDHVDVDVGVGQRPEDRGGDARLVRRR